MQLLKITSTPIKYRIESERAKLTVVSPANEGRAAGAFQSLKVGETRNNNDYHQNVGTHDAGQTENVSRLRSDRSFDVTNMEQSDGGSGRSYGYGRRPARIQKNNISGIIEQKSGSASIERAFDELEEIIPDGSWEPDKDQGKQTETSMEDSEKKLEFTPATCRLIVEELANVKIEYLGGFNYFPKSSAPDYEDPDIS